jgi:hypothetical protein
VIQEIKIPANPLIVSQIQIYQVIPRNLQRMTQKEAKRKVKKFQKIGKK